MDAFYELTITNEIISILLKTISMYEIKKKLIIDFRDI